MDTIQTSIKPNQHYFFYQNILVSSLFIFYSIYIKIKLYWRSNLEKY